MSIKEYLLRTQKIIISSKTTSTTMVGNAYFSQMHFITSGMQIFGAMCLPKNTILKVRCIWNDSISLFPFGKLTGTQHKSPMILEVEIQMKRKCLAVGIILLFIGTAILPSSGQKIEKTSLPASRGHWLYVGGSGPGNYSLIQDAIDNASDGDTIFVFAGLYKENVYINKSLNLIGENRDTTIIDANGSDSAILSVSSDVSIIGFTVQNSGGSTGGNYHAGIFIYTYCNNNTISGNKIINNNFGITLNSFSSNNSINNNIITQNKKCGIYCYETELLTIEKNKIMQNDGGGILLERSYHIKIIKNHIDKNGEGVLLYLSSFCDISENSLSNNSVVGITIISTSVGNRFSSNNFINNTKDADFDYAFLFLPKGNQFIKNYWDSYIGIGPKVICGTIEMVLLAGVIGLLTYWFPDIYIIWFEFDRHPAREPYDIPGMR